MKNKKKTLKVILIGAWIIIAIVGTLLLSLGKAKILKDDKLDFLPSFTDKEQYNFDIQIKLNEKYSPLYTCEADIIPSYLDDLAYKIDPNLTKVESEHFLKWQNNDKEDIISYNIDTTVLNLYLETYPQKISFNTVDRFISNYIDPNIQYFDIKEQKEDDIIIYTANRKLGNEELINSYGLSDFFYIENGYLINARILLADIQKVKEVVPLINDMAILEQYVNQDIYPKNIIVNTSEIIQSTPQNYENFDLDFKYNSCSVKNINTKLYFTSCNSNYIYYVYEIDGVCDIVYKESLYTVPFKGFINAIDPQYVKSIQ